MELIKEKKMLIPLNFESIPLSYSNWDAVQAVVSVHPQVFREHEDDPLGGLVGLCVCGARSREFGCRMHKITKTKHDLNTRSIRKGTHTAAQRI